MTTKMNNYVQFIPVTLILVAITLLGACVVLVYPPSAFSFGVVAGQRLFPERLYTLVTYSLLPGGLGHWILGSASLLCSGLIAERAVKPWVFWILVSASSILGATVFLVSAEGHGILVGSAQIAWGVGGATLMLGGARWKLLPWFGKIYIVWLGLSFCGALFDVFLPESALMALSQLAAGLFGILLATTNVYVRHRSATA